MSTKEIVKHVLVGKGLKEPGLYTIQKSYHREVPRAKKGWPATPTQDATKESVLRELIEEIMCTNEAVMADFAIVKHAEVSIAPASPGSDFAVIEWVYAHIIIEWFFEKGGLRDMVMAPEPEDQ